MLILIHPHAQERMQERGAKEDEVRLAVTSGEQFPARLTEPTLEEILSIMLNGRVNFIRLNNLRSLQCKKMKNGLLLQ